MQAQMLDSMDIERERGITIKANTVRIDYLARDGQSYVLNLIDTPGHVDFAYEVSRSMRAVEGSLLVVDSSQGVEAQTLANVYHALDADHEIVPVLNKIDLPAADCDRVAEQIEDVIGIDASEAIRVSAKTGEGISETLEAIVNKLPAPMGNVDATLKAMLVDSWYDSYLGVIVLVRIIDGKLKKGDRVKFMSNNSTHHVDRIGVFRPQMEMIDELGPGEIGFLTASIKQVRDTRVGDTITHDKKEVEALPGFKPAQPVVFCGLFPVDAALFEDLRDSIDKLALNDASFSFEMETSAALGFGFRCGFLEEPRIKATILVPDEYLGDVLKLCQDRRGVQLDLTYAGARAMVVYDLPLNEVVFDFYDRLKSVTKGYASFDYQMIGYSPDNLVKMSILVNDEPVDALSTMVHRDRADMRGRAMVEKLKDLIPRHMFKIPIQAAIGGKVIARETLSAMRKDVTAKCYGGDATRKKKLLEKQKAGKKKMRQFGKVDIPQEAFISALKMDG